MGAKPCSKVVYRSLNTGGFNALCMDQPSGTAHKRSPQEGVCFCCQSMASNSSALPRVTFQTPEKPGEESSHRKLGKLTIKYNRKDLQRWLDLEEWINTQLQELYQCRVSSRGRSAHHSSGEWDQCPVCWDRRVLALTHWK
uniref:Protein phosphatase 1 regulatory subunit 14D n=1 Tax=Amazona collaria TaxID=241587 RepID=A0A8B9EU52_9PSIT